jgi:hypothetical protein
VPSARRQAQKPGVFGSLIIKVKGLRIELTGKCFDLLFINNVGSARKALSNLGMRLTFVSMLGQKLSMMKNEADLSFPCGPWLTRMPKIMVFGRSKSPSRWRSGSSWLQG